MYIKIINLLARDGVANYKTLDINKIEQPFYDFKANECYLQYNESFASHEDLIEITEQEYLEAKEEQQKDVVSLEDKVKQLQQENEALRESQLSQDELIMSLILGDE
ncbi:hypothetical protein [Kurthia senegalensis]|uniref:hypothetical protein n=1 Tax=Kurthia senegalensis TaxID=1033740 RepID=UPI000289BC70|nr:hypothetical protein [Kurthia senegalensis]